MKTREITKLEQQHINLWLEFIKESNYPVDPLWGEFIKESNNSIDSLWGEIYLSVPDEIESDKLSNYIRNTKSVVLKVLYFNKNHPDPWISYIEATVFSIQIRLEDDQMLYLVGKNVGKDELELELVPADLISLENGINILMPVVETSDILKECVLTTFN